MKKLHLTKRHLKKSAAGLLVAAMMLALAACGSKSMDAAVTTEAASSWSNGAAADAGFGDMKWEDDVDYDYEVMPEESPMEPVTEAGTIADNSAYLSNRKLIKTVNLEVETKEFDQMMSSLERQVTALGGYIEDMYTYNGSRYSTYVATRNARMTARIPKQQLSAFLEMVSNVGNVVSRSENVEDVTLEYVDLESRKEALKVEQKRLLELLEKAESMEDILKIEDRMAAVRYQLESMESQLRTYDNKVDFATVYLDLEEVEELTPVEEETLGERIGHGFVENLHDVGEGLVDFFVWVVVSIPYLVIWAVVIIAIVFVVRICVRRRKTKKAERQAKALAESENKE